jgi:hypothetical protein
MLIFALMDHTVIIKIDAVVKQEAWYYSEQGQGRKGQEAWQVKLQEIN